MFIFGFNYEPSPTKTYRHFKTPLQQATVENIVANGEIAHYEQFFPLPQCCHFFCNNYTFVFRVVS